MLKIKTYFVSRAKYDKMRENFETILDLNEELQAELVLQRKLNKFGAPKKIELNVVGFDDNDCEPSEPAAREEYIKDVDYFYDKVLKSKLKTSVADIREMLSNVHIPDGLNMRRGEFDFYLRGMESMAWKMSEWATNLQAERRADLQDKENES